MAIDPERVKIPLRAAIECEDPASRRAFLDAEAGGDAEPRDRLDALLAGYDRPPGDQDRPLGADFEATDAPDATRSFSSPPPGAAPDDRTTVDRPDDDGPSPIDTIIADRYKVRQEIGEGGMGTVYLAEQLRPVRRRVALKLIKRGMDSRNVLARFESERQALALMEHPNIAHVLDAGTTADGRPFFVMELVKGIPITEYCDAHRLDLDARLALFRQVCSAVQHAHQKGIIHRDLKPSNILVESHDDKPVPKVIDFGLAKATSGMRLTEQSLFTAFGSVAGTPLYMAPEQASFNALDIDTRADIYALGVILYELLTGSTPIARESIRQAALDEMLRMIREVEPPAPSSRISTSEALPTLAANRQVEPARLSRLLRGDLDWIVMKALAKERERRYASAVGLADDVERYLNHEPVSAGPPTAAYRLRKFVRRNRVQVAAAGLVLLALTLGVVGTTLGLIEARRRAATGREAAGPGDEDERHPRLDLQGPRPEERPEGRRAAHGGPGQAAGSGDGGDRGGGDRRPAGRGPDADDSGHVAARPGLPGSGDRAVHQGSRDLRRRRSDPTTPTRSASMNNLAISYARRRPERPGAEALRGDAGIEEGEARTRPPRHAQQHEQPRRQLSRTPARTTGRWSSTRRRWH